MLWTCIELRSPYACDNLGLSRAEVIKSMTWMEVLRNWTRYVAEGRSRAQAARAEAGLVEFADVTAWELAGDSFADTATSTILWRAHLTHALHTHYKCCESRSGQRIAAWMTCSFKVSLLASTVRNRYSPGRR